MDLKFLFLLDVHCKVFDFAICTIINLAEQLVIRDIHIYVVFNSEICTTKR